MGFECLFYIRKKVGSAQNWGKQRLEGPIEYMENLRYLLITWIGGSNTKIFITDCISYNKWRKVVQIAYSKKTGIQVEGKLCKKKRFGVGLESNSWRTYFRNTFSKEIRKQ